jgi:hypothetical protein
MANAQEDLDPGDETRHTGDRIGFPHNVSDGTARDQVSGEPLEGDPVAFDGSTITQVTGDGSDDVAGIVFTYQYYGDQRHGPFIRGDRDATLATRGAYVADLSVYEDGAATVQEGGTLGNNGEIFVKHNIDGSLYEVLLR